MQHHDAFDEPPGFAPVTGPVFHHSQVKGRRGSGALIFTGRLNLSPDGCCRYRSRSPASLRWELQIFFPALRVPRHLVLTNEGIEYASRDSQGRLPWSTYRYYWENRWCFFVWHPRGSAWYLFPKRAFASASEVDQVRRLLQAHLKRSRWFYL